MAQSILIYGATGSFKTSNIAEYIRWLHERYGGIVRGVFGDNYGPCRAEIQDGILEPWDLTGEADPLACIHLASAGYWPEKLENGRVVGGRLKKDDYKGVSGYVVEGFKQNADLFMRLMERKRQATGEPLVGEHASSAYGQTVAYAVSSRGTYQFCQFQTHKYFKLGFKGMPVPWVAVTSHEYIKKSEGIYGVAVAGKALARTVPEWFDHTLHFESCDVEVVVGNQKYRRTGARAHFAAHLIDNVRWYAKLGVESYLMDYIYERWPNGYIPLVMAGGQYVSSLRTLLDVIDPMPETAEKGQEQA